MCDDSKSIYPSSSKMGAQILQRQENERWSKKVAEFFATRFVDTWDSLAQKFLTKYFPPSKTTKLRTEIVNFTQFDRESLYDAWERFKELLRKCPHHGMQDWLVIQVFYGGLSINTKTVVDAAAGGAFLIKDYAEAYELLEEVRVNLDAFISLDFMVVAFILPVS
ncbi:hypothetical protein L6164_033354 [Bauhinia variegata]|uniref:Uncharacterized protein n=1 Tax=Bauhinia variegata TaxID=167791 RepID=A0ACB9KRF7_BAUVA|nr:hypothetical protein L6164_033354 [Bauhinia variegata]